MQVNNNYKSVEAINGIGERIRLVRKLLKVTQGEFAAAIGLKRYGAVSRYEKNVRTPDTPIIRIISHIGNTTEKWLNDGTVNTKTCDRIIEAFKINYHEQQKKLHREYSDDLFNRSLSVFARNLDVSVEYIECIRKHKIDPSPNFIKKYCHVYTIDPLIFKDILMASDFEAYLYEATGRGAPHKKNDILDEINLLLIDDEEAQKMVLEILRSRKAINENTEKLAHKKSNNSRSKAY